MGVPPFKETPILDAGGSLAWKILTLAFHPGTSPRRLAPLGMTIPCCPRVGKVGFTMLIDVNCMEHLIGI